MPLLSAHRGVYKLILPQLYLEHARMIFATTCMAKISKFRGTSVTDLDHKGVQSTKNKTEPPYMGQLQNFRRLLFLGSLGQK